MHDTQDTVMTAQAASTAAQSRFDSAVADMFTQCDTALHAFVRLRELSEDMRILSLNAELAAGRAGTAGVAVRALTQYTRQLVSQLNRVQEDMHSLQGKAQELAKGASDENDSEDDVVSSLAEHAKQISVHAQTIRRIAEQSNGIATNIAIEAAGAGRYEPEFRTVANTMKRYITDLRAMVDDSDRAVKTVLDAAERLSMRRKA